MILDSAARVLPKDWKELSLNNACELITDGSHFSPATTETGYPYITVRDLNDSGIDFNNCKYISEKSYEELTKNGCRPQKNDVLFSKDGTVGKVALIETDIDFVVLSSLAILRPNISVVDSRFLRLAMQSPAVLESALGMKTGTALRRIVLKTVTINVPPLEEQLKIVEILEKQFSRLDAALASVRAVRKKTVRFRRSLLHAAFTGALTGHGVSRGNAPDGWTTTVIADVADFIRGVTYKKSDARNKMEIGFLPLIRATNIDNESLTYDEFVFIPQKAVKPEQLIRINDMVMAASSGSISVVGKSAPVLLDFEATFGAFCAVLRPKDVISPEYFRLYVQSPICRETWSDLARGTNINNLKSEQVLTTVIPVPPLDEQTKIVKILDEQLSHLDASLTVADAIEKKASALRRSLLHAAFTGELTKEWREGAHV